MKNPLVVLLGVVFCCISLPILITVLSYRDVYNDTSTTKHTIINNKIEKKIIDYETVDKETPIITVYNHKLNKNQEMDLEDYLCGVLSGEMSADFDLEALKAQALAARTYVLYKQDKGESNKHKGAVVCTDYKHCQEYKSYEELKKIKGEDWIKKSYPKIKQAVSQTKGQIITYNGKPILPLYFSTSSGKTENSEEVFAASYPYLKSVKSPQDKNSPKYISNMKITNKNFVDSVNKRYSDIKLENSNLESKIKIIDRSDGGAIEKIKIGDKELSGRDIRSMFNLNSANFEIKFGEGYIDFVVKGYGHGVGMSQWGAQGMAEEGYEYYEILEHYYSGSKIKDLY